MTLRLHNFIEKVDTLGPGTRCCIWFQGCCRRCKGCMTPDSQDMNGGYCVQTQALVEQILGIDGIEGVTISGGDPFCQPDALYELVKAIKTKSDLSVMIYTGFYLDELRAMHQPKVDELITSLADLIIDGPYIEELNDEKSLRGSSNQSFHFITPRYRDQADMFGADGRKVSIQVREDRVDLIGIPGKKVLEKWNAICEKLTEESDEA